MGRGLGYKEKDVFVVSNPQDGFLFQIKMSSEFVFMKEQDFFTRIITIIINYHGNTFQHCNYEEIMIPYIEMKAK